MMFERVVVISMKMRMGYVLNIVFISCVVLLFFVVLWISRVILGVWINGM